jgi:alanyl-tRNA synthetase
MITANQLREKFESFYKSKGHVLLPSSSLVPKEDPTVLFTTAGMQPLIPNLMGQEHPSGKRLVNLQKCLRTGDILEVGDNRHLTFFEMMGVWSLGDYFKKEAIQYTFEFLTSKDYLGLDPRRLFVTVYKGSKNAPVDTEAISIWQEQFKTVGIDADSGVEFDFNSKTNSGKYIYRITEKSGKDNWWGLPYKGPCGPCSEVYYLLEENELDVEKTFADISELEVQDFIENQIVEIWNNVFMQYVGEKTELDEPVNITPLESKNIDTGAGFERILTILNQKETPYETDLFEPILRTIQKYSKK